MKTTKNNQPSTSDFESCSQIKLYKPSPVDTTNIELPESLLSLQEKIAENVHEVWAEGRLKEGWTYGQYKDDLKKTTPLLVPYRDLPESEKDYDRRTSIETLKLIISLGYTIEKRKV